MIARSVILVGGPDSGKTNYIGRFWAALQARKGRLVAPEVPTDIKYVEETLAHLMQGKFAPRSDKGADSRRDFVVPVERLDHIGGTFRIVVPDVSGELWKSAVETFEIPEEWMEELKQSAGALLFVRVLSDQNVAPLDWVNAEQLLRIHGPNDANDLNVPTQVLLCELLRFLEHTLQCGRDGAPPRVAVAVTAWDLLDQVRAAAGPMAFLATEYPLFAGKLKNSDKVEVRVFGVSVVGGNFADQNFRDKFLESGDLRKSGFCVVDVDGEVQKDPDLTYPVAWLVEPLRDQ